MVVGDADGRFLRGERKCVHKLAVDCTIKQLMQEEFSAGIVRVIGCTAESRVKCRTHLTNIGPNRL